MGNEEPGKPKSPWGEGAKHERRLGPEEVQRIRSDALNEPKKERNRTIARFAIPIPTSESLLPAIHEYALESFGVAFMKMKGNSFTKSYRIGSDGYLETQEERSGTPDLLACVQAPQKDSTWEENKEITRLHFTSEHLREAAKEITEKFPYIVFEFQESAQRDEISYTAMIKKVAE